MVEKGEELTLAQLHERNRSPPTTPVAVRLPEPMLEELDDIWRERGYDSRSEFVRTVLERVAEEPGVLDDAGSERANGRLPD